MKKLFLILILLAANYCFAQVTLPKDYNKFVRNFSMVIYHPVELLKNHIPVVCLIKVQTDSVKNVLDIQLSDSADTLLKAEFKGLKHSLDVKSLERYLKSEYNSNSCKTFLIPLSYGIRQVSYNAQVVSMADLYKYSKFNGKDITGNLIFLTPIYTESGIQR